MASEPPQTQLQPPPQSDLPQVYQAITTYPFDSDPDYLSGLSSILGHPGTPVSEAELAQKDDIVLQAKCFYFSRKYNTIPIDPAAYMSWLAAAAAASSSSSQPEHTSTLASEENHSQESQAAPTMSAPEQTKQATSTISTLPATASAPAASRPQPEQEPPPYPTSFAAIVDLITNNKPIPGIVDIPTTVLEPGSSKADRAVRRRKPWEKDPEPEPEPEPENTAAETETENKTTDAESGSLVGGEAAAGAYKSEDLVVMASESENGNKGKKEQEKVGVVHILQPNAIADAGLIAKD